MNADKGFYDFKSDHSLEQSFAYDYLRQYYTTDRPVTFDETEVFNFIQSVLPCIGPIESAIEIGCGPTIHHALMLAPYIQKLVLADYLEENLAVAEKWLNRADDAWDWTHYTEFILKNSRRDFTLDAIQEREQLTRNIISCTRTINIMDDLTKDIQRNTYDLVSSFYCTEEVALNMEIWEQIISNISALIKPGGYLLMSCLAGTNYYLIKSNDGKQRSLPCVELYEADVVNVLKRVGFDLSNSTVVTKQTPQQATEGVPGVILVCATKTGATQL